MLKIEHLQKRYDNFALDCSLEEIGRASCRERV